MSIQENVDVTVTEPRRGKPVEKFWHIKGLKEAFGYNLLKTQATCRVEMGEFENIPVFLDFYFKEVKRAKVDPTNYNSANTQEMYYLDLYARTVTHQPKMHFVVDLDLVDENGVVKPFSSQVKDHIVYYAKGSSEEDCVKYAFFTPYACQAYLVTSSTVPQQILADEYRFKITVTPLRSNEDLEAEYKKTVGSLSHDLGSLLLGADKNYSDLKLEMKDNITLSAHKFMLAARSPYFKTLLEEESKKEDFDGTIKLSEVNAKPMIAILHWMYTGDVSSNAGRVMEEIVAAAVTFKLTGLLKFLDKKLISICNPENMFDLYKVAKANAMNFAIADISDFIKQNV